MSKGRTDVFTVIFLMGVWFALLMSVPANAQTPGADNTVIEEILVTARKREESLKEVPASVQIVDIATIENLQAVQLSDVFDQVPNLSRANTGSGINERIYVRGFNAYARNVGIDAGYAVYIDGIYTGRLSAYNRSLLDVERVETVLGPQSTIFGKNTTLGVTNIVTKRPGRESEVKASVNAGNFSRVGGSAHASVPISDTFAGSLSVLGSHRDAYSDAVNFDFDGHTLFSARGRLVGDYDSWNFDISFDSTTERSEYNTGQPVPGPDSQPQVPDLGAAPVRTFVGDHLGGTNVDDWGASILFNFDTGLGTLTSASSFRKTDGVYDIDDDGRSSNPTDGSIPASAFVTLSPWNDIQEVFTQEFRLLGESGPINYLVGAFYLSSEVDQRRAGLVDANPYTSFADVDTTAFAAFANVIWSVTDRFELEAGLRYTDEEKDLVRYQTTGGAVQFDLNGVVDDQDVSPTFTARFDITDNISTYARYAQGFKSGGFNTDLVLGGTLLDFAAISFDAEELTNIEVGLKTVFLDGALQFNIAAFRMEIDDFQANQFVTVIVNGQPLSESLITNAATAESNGFEADLNWSIGDLVLGAAVGINDAEFTDYRNANSAGADFTGNSAGGPDTSAQVSADYSLSVGNWGEGSFWLQWTSRDELYIDAANTPRRTTDDLSEVNARLKFTPNDARYSISLWANNLLDDDHVALAFSDYAASVPRDPANPVPGRIGRYNDPRTFGIAFDFEF